MLQFHARLLRVDTLHKQLEYIVFEKDELNRIREIVPSRFNKERSSVRSEYLDYLNRNYEYTATLMEIRRSELKDRFDPDHAFRILLNTTVPQFGLFIRLLIEKQIVQQSKVADMFKFFSSNFYTKNASFISAKSLQDKSTSVLRPDAMKLYRFLLDGIDWLDNNFHVKDQTRFLS